MLDKKTVNKYININEKMIIAGQTSGGIWYIKELPAKDTNELETLIGECNRICNVYNEKKNGEETKKKTTKKDKVVSSISTPNIKPEVKL